MDEFQSGLIKKLTMCILHTILILPIFLTYIVKYYDNRLVGTFYWSLLVKKAYKSAETCFYLFIIII